MDDNQNFKVSITQFTPEIPTSLMRDFQAVGLSISDWTSRNSSLIKDSSESTIDETLWDTIQRPSAPPFGEEKNPTNPPPIGSLQPPHAPSRASSVPPSFSPPRSRSPEIWTTEPTRLAPPSSDAHLPPNSAVVDVTGCFPRFNLNPHPTTADRRRLDTMLTTESPPVASPPPAEAIPSIPAVRCREDRPNRLPRSPPNVSSDGRRSAHHQDAGPPGLDSPLAGDHLPPTPGAQIPLDGGLRRPSQSLSGPLPPPSASYGPSAAADTTPLVQPVNSGPSLAYSDTLDGVTSAHVLQLWRC